MSTFLKTLMLAGLLLGWAVLPAYAEPGAGEEGQDDISAKIQKQMDKIIELMEKNEKALLALSTGDKNAGDRAKPEAVDVKPPALPPEGGSTQPPKGQGTSGVDVQKALDELIKGQRKAAGTIPSELEELVRMVPQ